MDARTAAAGGWLANGHKRVEKLDRETLAVHTEGGERALLFAVRRSLMKLVGGLFAEPAV